MKSISTIAILALGLISLFTIAFVWATWREPIGPPVGKLPEAIEMSGDRPESGRLVGRSESEIEARFGAPTTRSNGHFGLPSLSYRSKFYDAVTVSYRRPSGTHFLSYCRQNGARICFESVWCPNGWVID